MAPQAKTLQLIAAARAVLEEHHPMTLRQVYYQLVSKQVIANKVSQYKRLSNALVAARQQGLIPWEWVEDRLRRPRTPAMWRSVKHFGESVGPQYRRNVFATKADLRFDGKVPQTTADFERMPKDEDLYPLWQSRRVEVWLEKDALSGIFEDILDHYGVTLHVGRGFTSWTSLKDMAGVWHKWEHYNDDKRYCAGVTLLTFSDFDPSGWNMVDDLDERLAFFSAWPNIVRCALLPEDVDEYNLPPAFAKDSDTRKAAFVELHGDVAVELDALPIEALQERIVEKVEEHMDMEALKKLLALEEQERREVVEALSFEE